MRNDPFRLDRVDEKRKDASTLGGRGQQFRLRRGRLAEYIGFEAAEGSTTFYEYLERIPCLANDRLSTSSTGVTVGLHEAMLVEAGGVVPVGPKLFRERRSRVCADDEHAAGQRRSIAYKRTDPIARADQ